MCQGKFGALGLSRRSSLMYKSLEFSSLHSLVEDYKQAYSNCGHTLLKVIGRYNKIVEVDTINAMFQVRIGELVTHDAYSVSPISWRGLTLRWTVTDC